MSKLQQEDSSFISQLPVDAIYDNPLFGVIITTHPSDHIIYFNDWIQRALGFLNSNLKGKILQEVIKGSWNKINSDNHHKDLMEFECIDIDGNKINLLVSSKIINHNNEELHVRFFNETGKDKLKSTDVLKTTRLLKESQKVAKVGNWELDIENDVLLWSDEVYRILGLKPQSSKATFKNFINFIYPEDRDWVLKAYSDHVENKAPYDVIHRILLKDGSIKWVNEKCNTIYDEKDNPIRSLGTVADVTKMKIVENELNDYKNKLEEIVHDRTRQLEMANRELYDFKYALDQTAIVSISDEYKRIQYINEKFSEISGYSRAEIINQTYTLIDSGEHPESFFDEIWKTVTSGKTWKGVIKNKAKNGQYFWTDTTVVPFLDINGNPYQYLEIKIDITKQKENEFRLEERNEELNKFTYIVSHDLKAPLRGINNLVEWIKEDLGDEKPSVTENLSILSSRVSRMNGFINGLLEYSRIGKVSITKEDIDLKELISDLIHSLSSDKNVEIKLTGSFPILNSYRLFLNQVFLNLLSNAIKHNDKKQCVIIISCSKINSENYQFEICDNGPGIPVHAMQKVFDIFQTLSSKDHHENTGIGLSIVQKIINELNGKIWIENNKDLGCTFKFHLPI